MAWIDVLMVLCLEGEIQPSGWGLSGRSEKKDRHGSPLVNMLASRSTASQQRVRLGRRVIPASV